MPAAAIVKLLVPVEIVSVEPVIVISPDNNSLIFLFESTIRAELAVRVPGAWSNASAKYLPPITKLVPSAGLPTYRREPPFE